MHERDVDDFTRLCQMRSLDPSRLKPVVERFPFRASHHVLRLAQSHGDPIWRQITPDLAELADGSGWEDPLAEEVLSAVPNLVHRYPRRVLWLVSQSCAAYCRFCTRKRRWARPTVLTDALFHAGVEYIRKHPEVREVLLSGGDPLLLPLDRLETILDSLRSIPHVEIIRIGTRAPSFLPRVVTAELASLLARYHPLYVSAHFNHPVELSSEAAAACAHLANAGIPLGSQTVLLKGINDQVGILEELFQHLLRLRVRPYYLMQMDLTRSTAHFRTPIHRGMEILQGLRNRISGLAMPHFVIDLPGGQGKVPLVPNRITDLDSDRMRIMDWLGRPCTYPLLPGEGHELRRWLDGSS